MKITFVGLEKDYSKIDPSYIQTFNKYHLEIPWYYAECGNNTVYVTAPNPGPEREPDRFSSGGYFGNISEHAYRTSNRLDPRKGVIVHWRKWRDDLYDPQSINVLHCCDHSYSVQWKQEVNKAFRDKKLYAILCYRSWHQRNMGAETELPLDRLLTDMTLGVDSDIYFPAPDKDPFQMLWSSDPGRGLNGAISLAVQLHRFDKRFRLHICYPDYVSPPQHIDHPALVWHGFVPNGPKLWNLFNTSGILPYTSTFMEPSSRAHRQSQAAGSLVLYPPHMGSPSELIEHNQTGIVAPIAEWTKIVLGAVRSGRWKEIGSRAREFALTQTWAVQTRNFNNYFEKLLGEKG